MQMDLMHMAKNMGAVAWGVVIVLFIMSMYSIAVMIERYYTYSQATKQSRKYAPEVARFLKQGKIKEPKKTKDVPPQYPDIAKQARVQGVVILECTISPQGRVSDVKILRGIPLLNEAALTAVKQWVYSPTLLNGVPVPVIMTVTVNFRLQ